MPFHVTGGLLQGAVGARSAAMVTLQSHSIKLSSLFIVESFIVSNISVHIPNRTYIVRGCKRNKPENQPEDALARI